MTPAEALTQLTQVNNLTAIAAEALQEVLTENERLKADNKRLSGQLEQQQSQELAGAVARAQAATEPSSETDSEPTDG